MMAIRWTGLLGLALSGVAAGSVPATAAAVPAQIPAVAAQGDSGCLPRASDGAATEPSREALRAAGSRVVGEMINGLPRPTFEPGGDRPAPELGILSMDAAFGGLWARCGLTRRDRSLVTLGILMALRANGELGYHFRIARANGLTRREIEEAIYQASGYAGFPAAANASTVYGQVLTEEAAAAGQ